MMLSPKSDDEDLGTRVLCEMQNYVQRMYGRRPTRDENAAMWHVWFDKVEELFEKK